MLANWGSILSFVDKMNYKSLHPKSRRVKTLNGNIIKPWWLGGRALASYVIEMVVSPRRRML